MQNPPKYHSSKLSWKKAFQITFGGILFEFCLGLCHISFSSLPWQIFKSIARSKKMLDLLNNAVDTLRSKHKHGEQYYWILYYTYLCPQQLQNIEEICKIRNLSEPTLNFSILPVLFIIPNTFKKKILCRNNTAQDLTYATILNKHSLIGTKQANWLLIKTL